MKTASLIVSVVLLIGGLSAYRYYHRSYAREAQAAPTAGERVYLESCAACHGERGDGNGPEADRLKTKPRDFTSGIYKFRSTPSGSLPLDQDILRTVLNGVRGTSMLAQAHLSKEEAAAVVEYIKNFSSRFEMEKPGRAITVTSRPVESSRVIALGKAKYEEAGCAQCHGRDGRAESDSANGLKDDWGEPISATDLTLKPFKSGPHPEDLYRTITTGLNGTPMPSYAEVLTPEERWSLVSYVLSIATRDRPKGMMGLVGEEVQGMRIDMRAAMAGMMGGRGMRGKDGGMMDRNMREMMRDMMGK